MIKREEIEKGLKVRLDKTCGFMPKELRIGANFEYDSSMELSNEKEVFLFKTNGQGFYIDLDTLNECFSKVVTIRL